MTFLYWNLDTGFFGNELAANQPFFEGSCTLKIYDRSTLLILPFQPDVLTHAAQLPYQQNTPELSMDKIP